jgi:hypothetical protein
MGTSISQRSPDTAGWKTVSACYIHENVPLDRAATELWRAALKQDNSLLDQLGTKPVAQCIQAASQPLTREAALRKAQEVDSLKQNTVAGEFAKRAMVVKAAGGFSGESAASVLFRQLTDYLVSRDIAGYVGRGYRCKSVGDLRALKEQLGAAVAKKVKEAETGQSLASKTWSEAFPAILERLQQP